MAFIVPSKFSYGGCMKILNFIFCFLIGFNVFAKEGTPPMPEKSSHPDISAFFNAFNKDNIDLADHFYAADIVFEDPIVKINGLSDLKKYYAGMYKNVISIRFEFHDVITEGDRQVGIWTMHLRAKNLNGGEEVAVKGTSHVVYKDGKAVYHRDYFDMGAFLYEHIPVLGTVIRKLKELLH
jgi:limonene-1,2-epoxide hydrolase